MLESHRGRVGLWVSEVEGRRDMRAESRKGVSRTGDEESKVDGERREIDGK